MQGGEMNDAAETKKGTSTAAGRAAKIDETTKAATEIIDAENEAREAKTARLRAARQKAEAKK